MLTDLVGVNDVRVAELARAAGLVEEHLAEVGRLRVLGANHFQRARADHARGQLLLGAQASEQSPERSCFSHGSVLA